MNRLGSRVVGIVLLVVLVAGCHAVEDTNYTPGAQIAREGTFVFVRPDRFTLLGTKSLRDYSEIVYENQTINEAGQMVVKFGLRNRGGQHWWDTKGPRILIAAKAVFYEVPVKDGGITGPPLYETNWQRLTLTRGETIHYTFTSPVDAGGYQVTLSDAF